MWWGHCRAQRHRRRDSVFTYGCQRLPIVTYTVAMAMAADHPGSEVRASLSQVRSLMTALADRSMTSGQRRRAAHAAHRALDQLESALHGAVEAVDAGVDGPGDGVGPASGDDPLETLRRRQEALDTAKAALQAAAEDARAAGASWRRIGEALGIAAQSAHKRFDPRARRRHAEYMRARYRPAEEEL